MNPLLVAVGAISLIACLILFILEKITPKSERVPVTPFWSYSHEWARIQIKLLLMIGIIFIAIGVTI
jgi:hypothetical protein